MIFFLEKDNFMKKLIYLIFLLTFNLKSADFEILITGTDKLTSFETIKENHLFMTYENTFQFTTNTSMYGYGTCSGIIEIIDGKNLDNILCVHIDNYGSKGYFKNVETENIIRNQDSNSLLGELSGSVVASWKLLNGTGRYKDLSGLVLKGAYLSIGKNKHNQTNWIFQGKSENIPDSIIKRLNNYIPKNKE